MIENIMNKGLPKWPHTIIVGKRVSVEQAKEIIFKTDNYFYNSYAPHSNWNKGLVNEYRRRSGLYLLDIYGEMVSKACSMRNEDNAKYPFNDEINYPQLFEFHDRLITHLGVLEFNSEIEYIRNDIADSCYIGGANGYMTANGEINFNRNIGKWPSLEDVYKEFTIIAKHFPYLEMQASVYDAEQCERDERPVNLMASFIISNGNVLITDMDLGLDNDNPYPDDKDFLDAIHGHNSSGIPREWFDEFADRVKEAMHDSGIYDEMKMIIEKYEGGDVD